MTTTEKFFVECVKYGIKNNKILQIPNDIDYKQLYKLCELHSMSVVVFSALEKVKDDLLPDFLKLMQNSVHKHIVLDTQSAYDKKIFLNALENKNIKHMPLKGYYLKNLYPSTAMRYTSDCDILIDINQLSEVRALVEELGLKTKRHDEHHDIVYFPVTKTVFELHKVLFVGALEKYFGTGFEFAHLKEGTNAFYEMSSEDFYISILAHSAYHFAEDAGVGIRHLTDIYLYRKAYVLNDVYIDTQLKKCNLLEFKNKFESVAKYFFDDFDNIDEDILMLANHIIESSLLSNEVKKSASDIAANNSYNSISDAKKQTIFRKIFPIKYHMMFSYPVLKKHIYLLPAFYIFRWLQVIFTRPRNIVKLKEYGEINEKSVSNMKKIRNMLGINNL